MKIALEPCLLLGNYVTKRIIIKRTDDMIQIFQADHVQLSVFREHGIDDPLQIFAENNLHLPKIKSWQWFLSRTGHNTLLISQFCNCAYPFVHPRYLKHSNKTKFCNVQYMVLKNRKVDTLSKAVTKKFQHFSSRTPHHSKQYQSPPEGWFLFLLEKNNQESAHANLTHNFQVFLFPTPKIKQN